MSNRVWLAIGLSIAAFAVGGWRTVVPGADSTSKGVDDSISSMLATTTQAAFTGAAASLDAQRTATGSYAGTRLAPGMVLVRADATSYCVQTRGGTLVQHETGPGGSPAIGPC
jgi:hypothetical protein